MPPSPKRFIALYIVLLIATPLAACGGTGTALTAGDAIVYVTLPLSGGRADAGQTALGGVRLAAKEINRSGGLLGHRLVVRALDDQSNSDVAIANVEVLRQAQGRNERIIGVVGHFDSAPIAAALPLYQGMGLVLITPAAGERSLTYLGHTLFFRVNANDSLQAAVVARFLVEQMRAQRVAVIHNGTRYGRELTAGLIDNLQNVGAAVPIQVEFDAGQQDGGELLAQIREASADALFFAGYAVEAANLRARFVEAGVELPMLASDGAFQTAAIDEAAGAAEGMYVSAFAPSPRLAADKRWIDAYRALESRDPGPYSINGYVAMQALAAGVRAANSFQGEEIANALRAIEIETLLGPLRFGGNGDRSDAQIWIYRVEGNEFKQVE